MVIRQVGPSETGRQINSENITLATCVVKPTGRIIHSWRQVASGIWRGKMGVSMPRIAKARKGEKAETAGRNIRRKLEAQMTSFPLPFAISAFRASLILYRLSLRGRAG